MMYVFSFIPEQKNKSRSPLPLNFHFPFQLPGQYPDDIEAHGCGRFQRETRRDSYAIVFYAQFTLVLRHFLQANQDITSFPIWKCIFDGVGYQFIDNKSEWKRFFNADVDLVKARFNINTIFAKRRTDDFDQRFHIID